MTDITRGPNGLIPGPGYDAGPAEVPKIAVGSLVLFSSGYADTYCTHGLYRVLQPLCLKDAKPRQQKYPEEGFVCYLLDRNIIERVEYTEINL